MESLMQCILVAIVLKNSVAIQSVKQVKISYNDD